MLHSIKEKLAKYKCHKQYNAKIYRANLNNYIKMYLKTENGIHAIYAIQ